RLDAVLGEDLARLARTDLDGPELARRCAAVGADNLLGREDDLLPVGRPGRVAPEAPETPRALAGRAHDEDPAVAAERAIGDQAPVGRERGCGALAPAI